MIIAYQHAQNISRINFQPLLGVKTMSNNTQIDLGKTPALWQRWSNHFGEQARSKKAFGAFGARKCEWICDYFDKYDYQKEETFSNEHKFSDEDKLLEMVHTFLIFTNNGPNGEVLFDGKEQIRQGLMTLGYGCSFMLENGYPAKTVYWHICSSLQLMRKNRSATVELMLAYLNILGIGREKFGEPTSDDIDDIRNEISDEILSKNG